MSFYLKQTLKCKKEKKMSFINLTSNINNLNKYIFVGVKNVGIYLLKLLT